MEAQETPRSLKDFATSLQQSRAGVSPSTPSFTPVDQEEVARDLKLYVRAAEAGQQDDPPSDAKAQDVAENEVRTSIERYARQAAEEYRSQMDVCDERIRSAAITKAERLESEAAGKGVLADLKTRISDDLDHLSVVWRDTIEAVETQFQTFRIRNGLTKLPKIISPVEMLLRSLILAAIIALGTMLNGRFFPKPGDAGSIGSVALALTLTILNVAPAVFYARHELPRLFDRRFGSKLVGFSSTCLFLGWTLAANLLMGHFRDLFVAHEGKVSVLELSRRLTLSPFVLADSKSWLLAVLGLALSALAVIDAAGMDDLHPGYGALGRRRAAALGAYGAKAASYVETLTAVRDAAVEELNAVIEAIRQLEHESYLAMKARRRLHREFAAHLDNLATIHEQLCLRYREINEHVRRSSVPRYFRLGVQRPEFLEPPDLQELTPPQDAWAQAIERMEHFIRTANSTFSEALPRYQAVEEPTEEEVAIEVTV